MSSEVKYFICRNEDCQKERELTGGTVFPYQIPEDGDPFFCPYCKSRYIENEGETFLLWDQGDKIFESSEDYQNFANQFEVNQIYFPKLVFRNIKEENYTGKNLSFNKCVIDELVIEDLDISAANYPIIFSHCVVKNIRISNSTIIKTSINSYKSLWSFFGINLFYTSVLDSFKIEGCETSLMISNCQVDCPIEFSKGSKAELRPEP